MLTRSLAALALILGLSATAAAHFVFIVPEAGGKARVIFSDSLEPDENVAITKIAGTKLQIRDADGKDSPLTWTKGDHFYEIKVTGTGSRIIHGVTDYGVLQKGTTKPYLLRYHPKAIVGPIPADGGKLGDATSLEIVPRMSGGKVAFEVLAKGKPVANAEVTVVGESGKKLETDAKGRTKPIKVTGKCGVWARHIDPTKGKVGGKSYDEARHYATLVFDLSAK